MYYLVSLTEDLLDLGPISDPNEDDTVTYTITVMPSGGAYFTFNSDGQLEFNSEKLYTTIETTYSVVIVLQDSNTVTPGVSTYVVSLIVPALQ